jgi:hypothetical protein
VEIRAARITFTHPLTGRRVSFAAEPIAPV